MNPFEGRTLADLESELIEANRVCRRTTGLSRYQDHQMRRRLICDEVGKHRRLSDEEYLFAYGHEALRIRRRTDPHPSVSMTIEGEVLNVTIEIDYEFRKGCKEQPRTFESGGCPGETDEYQRLGIKVVAMELDFGEAAVIEFDLNALKPSELIAVREWAERQVNHDVFIDLCEDDQAARGEQYHDND